MGCKGKCYRLPGWKPYASYRGGRMYCRVCEGSMVPKKGAGGKPICECCGSQLRKRRPYLDHRNDTRYAKYWGSKK